MIGLYAVRDGSTLLTAPEGIPYEMATVVLMTALCEGRKAEIYPVGGFRPDPISTPRRRNVRISIEISVDAEKASSLPGFDGIVGTDGEVEPPEEGLAIAAELLTNQMISLVFEQWKDRLDAIVEETRSEASCEYEVVPDTF